MKSSSLNLLRKLVYLSIITTSLGSICSQALAQTPEITGEIEPNVELEDGNVEINPEGNLETTIPLGGNDDEEPNTEEESGLINVENDENAFVRPSIGVENGEFNTDIDGTLNPDANVGGENGVQVNPNIGVRNGELSIDPEFDYNGAINNAKDQAIDFAQRNIFQKLGVDNFLTQLQQDFKAVTGDITTFLGFKGQEPEKGQAGIPNIQEAEVTFATVPDIDLTSDLFGTQTGSTFGNRDKLMQQYIGDLSQEISENSALSLRGQSIITGNIETANTIAAKSADLAEDSSGQDISQNIMRNKSLQDDLRIQLDTMTYTDRQEQKISDALNSQIAVQQMHETSKTNTAKLREKQHLNRAAMNTGFFIPQGNQNEEEEE